MTYREAVNVTAATLHTSTHLYAAKFAAWIVIFVFDCQNKNGGRGGASA